MSCVFVVSRHVIQGMAKQESTTCTPIDLLTSESEPETDEDLMVLITLSQARSQWLLLITTSTFHQGQSLH